MKSKPSSIRLALAAAVSFAALASCGRSTTPSGAPPSQASAAEESGAAPQGTASTASAPRPRSARLDDARWKRAMGEDPAGKQTLADALGAPGLLEALDDGGEITATALEALPLTDDADLALSELARRALAAANEGRGPILEAILAIAGRPANARESLDPEGAAAAGAAVLAIASNKDISREQRAAAISAARAFAEKKVVDPAKIPTDLDPN